MSEESPASSARPSPGPGADAARARRLLDVLVRALRAGEPGLGELRELARKGDPYAALDALHRHTARRTVPAPLLRAPWGGESLHRERARMALEDTFALQGVTARQPRRPDGGLDWSHRGPRSDPEWAWLLNRHVHLYSAMVAWKREGDSRYRRLVEEQLVDWIRCHPCPRGVSFSAAWRPLEAARRITGSWVHLCFDSGPAPILGPIATLEAWVSLLDHADVLRRRHSRRGNHFLSEMTALATLALAWPEFEEAGDWLGYAARTFDEQIREQTYPDGAHTELSNHYQRITTLEAQRFQEILELAGRPDLAPGLGERLERMWDYFSGVTRPDGCGPLNNDGGLDQNASTIRKFGLRGAHHERLHIATFGKRGRAPAPPHSRYYPWAGQAITRSSFRRSAQWARFDMGPHGTDHQHLDQLSIELMVGDRLLLADPGRYTYKPGPYRRYFTGPDAHNVVLLDGAGTLAPPDKIAAPLPVLAGFDQGAQCFAATARFAPCAVRGAGSSRWTRALLYVVGRYWLVLDVLLTFGHRVATFNWSFGPQCSAALLDEAALTCDPNEWNIVVRPSEGAEATARIVRGRTHPTPKGWFSRSYNERVPCPVAEYRLAASGPRAVAWLLHPAHGEAAAELARRCRVECASSAPGRWRVEVTGAGAPASTDVFELDMQGLERLGSLPLRGGRRVTDRPGLWRYEHRVAGRVALRAGSPGHGQG